MKTEIITEAQRLQDKLKELRACEEAYEWAEGKTIQEVWETCHRGDWMLWLFKRTNPNDIKLLFLAKGHCANTVRHLMKDERSIKAVDAAIAFGNGEITEEERSSAAYAAAYAAYAAYAAAADAAYAAYAAAAYAAAADAAADAAYAAAADAYAARKNNQLLTANICRQYLPCPVI